MKAFLVIWQPLERTTTERFTVMASSIDAAWDKARELLPEDCRILNVTSK